MNARVKGVFMVLALTLLVPGWAPVTASQHRSVKEAAHAHEADLRLAQEYQARLASIRRQQAELRENLEWLQIKINGIRLSGRPVGHHLYTSVAYKKQQIQALADTHKQVSTCLNGVLARLETYPTEGRDISVLEINEGQEALVTRLNKAGLSEWLEVLSSPEGVMVRTRLPILFASGSARIPDTYTPFLEKVAAFMKDSGEWIRVDGFCDKDPIKTPKFPSNFELGAIRATNVVHALVAMGVAPSKFKVTTTGKYRFPEARPATHTKSMERYVNITIWLSA